MAKIRNQTSKVDFRPGLPEVGPLLLEYDEFRNWAVCERICQESLQATTTDPAAARELAEEALSIAEQISGGETARHRLMAYALPHAAKVDTVLGDLDEAAEKMQRARELWQAGDGSDGLEDVFFECFAGGRFVRATQP